MSRFAFTSSIVLATFALAACGDDTSTSGAGGAGGASASSGDAASSGSQASSNASSSGSPASSSSGGDGGGDVTTGGSGGDTGSGGAPGTGGGGTGGGEAACAPACESQDPSQFTNDCQTCALASAQGECSGEAQACIGATAAKGDTEGCVTCGDVVLNGADFNSLCESNQEIALDLLECVCGVCG